MGRTLHAKLNHSKSGPAPRSLTILQAANSRTEDWRLFHNNMKITTLKEIYVRGFPISICRTEEGEIFAHFDHPVPKPEVQEAHIAYLKNEGILPSQASSSAANLISQTPERIDHAKIVVNFTTGASECFPVEKSEILCFDPSTHTATISSYGKIVELKDVEKIHVQN